MNVLIVRALYWPFVATVVGFALLDVVGTGLYLVPVGALALAWALWPRDSGPWCLLFGAFVAGLCAVGQAADVLYVPHAEEPAGPVDHLRLEAPWLAFLGAGAAVGVVGAVAWPRPWALLAAVAAAGSGWVAMVSPGVVHETRIFVLPGSVLMSAGAARCWWGSRGATRGLGLLPEGPPRTGQKW